MPVTYETKESIARREKKEAADFERRQRRRDVRRRERTEGYQGSAEGYQGSAEGYQRLADIEDRVERNSDPVQNPVQSDRVISQLQRDRIADVFVRLLELDAIGILRRRHAEGGHYRHAEGGPFFERSVPPKVGEYAYFDSRSSRGVSQSEHWLVITEKGEVGAHFSLPEEKHDIRFITCNGLIEEVM